MNSEFTVDTPESALDVLAEPLFTVSPGPERLSLSTLLARLLAGVEVGSFPHLAAEQHGHWWRFLTRCGAKALRELQCSAEEAGRRPEVQLAIDIERVLRTAGSTAQGWMLYQADLHLPGFLQPPFPPGRDPGQGAKHATCADLSTLTGEKSHDRKAETGRSRTPEQTVFGLVELQLGAYYGGPGSYASQITADGYCGTPFVGARISDSNGLTFRHDVQVLLDRWDSIVVDLKLEGDLWALWMEPWDKDAHPQPSTRLDPTFIPLARFVRLGARKGDVFNSLCYWPTATERVGDPVGGGNYGDPFVCLVFDGSPKKGYLKVRGTQKHGYDYREIVELLFPESAGGDVAPSVRALQHHRYHDRSDLSVLFEGIAYKQGGTEGFHRHEILLPASGSRRLGSPEPVRKVHGEMLQMVGKAEEALKKALRVLVRGEPKQGERARMDTPAGVSAAVGHLNEIVDQRYLDELFRIADRHEAGDSSWPAEWAGTVRNAAWQAFDQAASVLPLPDTRRWQRTVLARRRLRQNLSRLTPTVAKPPGRPRRSSSQPELSL